LRWHGEVCPNVRQSVTMDTRIHLNPALRADGAEKWVVKGLADSFPSRCAFSLRIFPAMYSC
jgi:hypothetical protein